MFARVILPLLDRRHIHYGWMIAAVTFLTMLMASAALSVPGVMLQPLSREFGWRTDLISSAIAIRFALYGLIGPFTAVLLQRYGPRRVVPLALLLLACGLLLATRMTSLWQLFLLWGVGLGAGSGLIALMLGATIATRWFDERRGLVLGLLTASSATGQLIFLPMIASLLEHHGWRVAVMPIALGCLVVAVLAMLLLVDRPQDLALKPYGAAPVSTASATHEAPAWRPSFLEPVSALASAMNSGTFWLLFGTFFVCGLSTNGLIQTHFVTLCGDFGLAAVPAASVLAMIGAFDFIGTIGSGWLSDRYDNRSLLFWYYGLRGLSLLWLPHSNYTVPGLALFAVFYGVDWVATVPPTVKLANAAFGKQRSVMIFGWIFAGHQIGGAVAAYGAGLSRALLNTYVPALYAAGAACIIAAAAMIRSRQNAAQA